MFNLKIIDGQDKSTPNKKVILYIEDDAVVSMLTKIHLEAGGYEVVHVYTGEKALEVNNSDQHVDLVLSDIDLGSGIDGTEATKQILEKRSIPAVFLSSHTDQDMVEKTEKITNYGYIVKNTGPIVLASSIKMAFKLFEATQKLANELIERERTRDILRLSEYFFKESQHAANIGSYKTDFIAGSWESSAVLDSIFGIDNNYTRSVQGWLDIVHPEDKEMMDSYLRKEVILQRKPFNKEYRIIRRADKSVRWVLGLGKVDFDDKGNLLTMIGTIQDITERKLLETDFEKSRALLYALIEGSTDAIFIKDLQGRYILFNQAAANFTGKQPEEVLGQDDYFLFPADQAETVMKGDRKIMFGGVTATIEEKVTTKQNKTITSFLATKGPIYDKQGKLIGMFGISRDITERKLAEEKHRKSEETLRKLFSILPAGITIVDDNYQVINMNSAAEKILELSYKDLIEGKQRSRKYLRSDGSFKPPAEFASHIAIDENRLASNIETGIVKEDGAIIWTSVSAVPLTSGGAVISTVDITDRKLAEAKIKAVLAEKELILKEVHHRIRNNMQSMISLLNLQLRTLREPSAITALGEAISRLQTMQLLYEKLYNAEGFTKVPIIEYIPQLASEIVSVLPQEKNISIEHNNIANLLLDAKIVSPLGIIINELLTNTIKYAFPEGHKLDRESQIRFSLQKNPDGLLELKYSDNGVGLPENFDLETNTGFGMVLIKGLAKQLRGDIKINNTPGQGAEFVITFREEV